MKIFHIISGDIFDGAEMQVLQTLHALKHKKRIFKTIVFISIVEYCAKNSKMRHLHIFNIRKVFQHSTYYKLTDQPV